MNVTEAAKALRVHAQTIYNMLERGDLKAEKKGVAWDIPASEIEKIKDERVSRLEQAEKLSSSADVLHDYLEPWTKAYLWALDSVCKEFTIVHEQKADEIQSGFDLRNALQEQIDKLQNCINTLNGTTGAFNAIQEMYEQSRALDREAEAALKGVENAEV